MNAWKPRTAVARGLLLATCWVACGPWPARAEPGPATPTGVDSPAPESPAARSAVQTLARPRTPAPPQALALPQTLTLPQAMALAGRDHPTLAAARQAVDAAGARIGQADLRPNPELVSTFENLGNDRLTGLDGPTVTVELAQRLELGGKRPARVGAAESARAVAEADAAAARRALRQRVGRAFFALVAAQRQAELTDELASVAREIRRTAGRRVEAGQVPAIEAVRAGAVATQADIDRGRAVAELAAAQAALAAAVNAPGWRGRAVEGDGDAGPLPDLAILRARLPRASALARARAEVAARRAQWRLARAEATPDLSVRGGVRHFREAGESTVVVGVSLPLPVFNRNQGQIAAAGAELTRAELEAQALALRLGAELEAAHALYAGRREDLRRTRTELLPAADESMRVALRGYELGKFSLLELLDARRAQAEARAQYARVLDDAHRARLDLDALVDLEAPADPEILADPEVPSGPEPLAVPAGPGMPADQKVLTAPVVPADPQALAGAEAAESEPPVGLPPAPTEPAE